MKIALYRNSLVSIGDRLELKASSKKIALLEVYRLNTCTATKQEVDCKIIQCHPDYKNSLKIFNNADGTIALHIELL